MKSLLLLALLLHPTPPAPLNILDDHLAGTWEGTCRAQHEMFTTDFQVHLVISIKPRERLKFQEESTFADGRKGSRDYLLWFDPATLTAKSTAPLATFTYQSQGLAQTLATGFGTFTLQEDQTSLFHNRFTHHMRLEVTPTTLDLESGDLYPDGERNQATWHYQRLTPILPRP